MLQALAGAEASSRGGLGVVRLAELVGSDKSQTSRTLATLAEHGLVERDPDTLSYRIGWQVFALAARAGEPRLLAAAPRLLRELVHQLGESAHLSVRQGASVLTLLSESPASAIHAPGLVGVLTPLANTSAGRALAFDLADDELAAWASPRPPTASPRRARSAMRSCARSSSRASWPPPRPCVTAAGASSRPSTSRRRPSASRTGWRRPPRPWRPRRPSSRPSWARRDNPRPRRTDQQFPRHRHNDDISDSAVIRDCDIASLGVRWRSAISRRANRQRD